MILFCITPSALRAEGPPQQLGESGPERRRPLTNLDVSQRTLTTATGEGVCVDVCGGVCGPTKMEGKSIDFFAVKRKNQRTLMKINRFLC